MDTWNISLIQLQSSPNKDDNLEQAARMVAEAAREASLVVLPELYSTSYEVKDWPAVAEPVHDGPTCRLMAGWAREHGVHLLGGSIAELDDGRVYNTATMWSPTGELLLVHRKVHLFDIDIPGGIHFFESDFLSAGREVSVVETPLGCLGVAICYDIRFPELSRAMALRGAEVILLPAAFNTTTGPAHWELMLRARAVENTVFLAGISTAPHPDVSYPAWGHTMWIDPFGVVQAEADRAPGIVRGVFDRTRLRQVRAGLPLLRQRRPDVYGA